MIDIEKLCLPCVGLIKCSYTNCTIKDDLHDIRLRTYQAIYGGEEINALKVVHNEAFKDLHVSKCMS